MNYNDDIPATNEGNVVEDMVEDEEDFDERNDGDDDDDGVMRDEWHEPTVVECWCHKVLGAPLGRKRGLYWFGKKSREPNITTTSLERGTGGQHHRLVIHDDDNSDDGQNIGQ
ncbi:hypothetical protein AMTR_s00018p00201750 [Amborella trichopoda]|uniref:Uncharacterized protein n=1 Tax=Amborella trichopoda TaxID=13333 RepID=W1PM59_AMBTC|nr:hypothetical protein AMTR_s00018p00201750 [Amborella trichopoda]